MCFVLVLVVVIAGPMQVDVCVYDAVEVLVLVQMLPLGMLRRASLLGL